MTDLTDLYNQLTKNLVSDAELKKIQSDRLKALKHLQAISKLRRKDIAVLINKPEQFVHRIFNGDRPMTFELACELKKIFEKVILGKNDDTN